MGHFLIGGSRTPISTCCRPKKHLQGICLDSNLSQAIFHVWRAPAFDKKHKKAVPILTGSIFKYELPDAPYIFHFLANHIFNRFAHSAGPGIAPAAWEKGPQRVEKSTRPGSQKEPPASHKKLSIFSNT